MDESNRNMLSVGVLLIIIVVAILLMATQIISIGLVIPLVLILAGCWVLVLSYMRSSQPEYPSGAFGTMGLGIVLIAFGVAWYLFSINWLFSLALILLVLGALAIAAALRRK
ncbi:MAG TPA: hypothetical protein VF893_08835 [Candidatus Bathyarchaeia archaeon]